MTDWKALGARLGRAFASLLSESAKERVRAEYAARFGRCRRCGAPLSGRTATGETVHQIGTKQRAPSSNPICETCHVDETLERFGGGSGGDA